MTDSPDELATRYAHAVDARDESALRSLFAPGATVVVPATITGGASDEVVTDVAWLLDGVRHFARTRHVVLERQITVDGDTAHGETRGEAHHLYRRGEQWHDYAMGLRYRDRYVRGAGGWRFTRRELVLDWARRDPTDEPDPGGHS